jgi:hypothetical protein
MKPSCIDRSLILPAAAAAALSFTLWASSHREAPLITTTPKLDCTDFYVFNSYEPGRENFVTLVANYLPLQDAYGGPNYFALDPDALYEIHIDNNGDAREDLTFQFRFSNASRDIALPIGPPGNQKTVAVPVLAVGQIGAGNTGALNFDQTYTVNLVRGPRRSGTPEPIKNADNDSATFTKPLDNVGTKTIPDYNAYANSYVYPIRIPGCTTPGKMFVGQRKDPFVVNLGETFDLVNISTSPIGPDDANRDSLAYKNVTSIILELPKECLLSAPDKPIIGAWTTASKIKPLGNVGQEITQVSRLGMPLVNEVVIGLKDKDKFNASEPKDDLANFADYVTHPTLPAIVELLFGAAGVKAPTAIPRNDLVAAFVTGVDGLNKDGSVAEFVRLNTAVAPTPLDKQNPLGVIAGISQGVLDVNKADLAGFPNGRRPGDDVVDIALRVAMGKLLTPDVAPSGDLPFTDGAAVNARMFLSSFPYLLPPIPGSPNEPSVTLTVQTASKVNGPFQSVPATWNANAKQLNVPKPDEEAGFVRTKSDRKVTLDGVVVDGNTIKVGVK